MKNSRAMPIISLYLVESVTAIVTIEAMIVEPQMTRRWCQQLAAYVSSGFHVASQATIGQQGVQFIQKNGHTYSFITQRSFSN